MERLVFGKFSHNIFMNFRERCHLITYIWDRLRFQTIYKIKICKYRHNTIDWPFQLRKEDTHNYYCVYVAIKITHNLYNIFTILIFIFYLKKKTKLMCRIIKSVFFFKWKINITFKLSQSLTRCFCFGNWTICKLPFDK